MVAKQLKAENETLKLNTGLLLKNYLTVLLGNRKMNSQQLSNLTGVPQDRLEDFLDQLIDEGRVDLEGDLYYKKGSIKNES